VLALCPVRGPASPVWGSAAAAADRGGESGRHGRLQLLAGFRALFCFARAAFLEHERAKTELKGLMPEDAKEAFGHGVRAKCSKAGAVSFEMIEAEAGHAPVH